MSIAQCVSSGKWILMRFKVVWNHLRLGDAPYEAKSGEGPEEKVMSMKAM